MTKILSVKTFWPSFMIIGLKMWPLKHTQSFSKIWTCYLVFDPKWTIFEVIRDFIKTNILTNFHDNWTENVDSREYTSQKVSERKNFEVGLLCSHVPSCDPRGGANIDPRGIIWTNLVEVQKKMLHTKYQSSAPSSFRVEEFWSLLSLFLCSYMQSLWQGQFWPKGRGPLGDAT